MLGLDAGISQRQMATKAGARYKIYHLGDKGGLDEKQLMRLAKLYRANAIPLEVRSRKRGKEFTDTLITHILQSGPAMMIVQDLAHWVAVIGYLPDEEKFVIYDPNESRIFFKWSPAQFMREAWNAGESASQSYALLLSRTDGRKPAWRVTKEWIKIHSRGSDCTAGTIASDLMDLVVNSASGKESEPDILSQGEDFFLADLLRKYRETILGEILYWQEGSGEFNHKDLKDLYSDYIVCAEACDLKISQEADHGRLVAGLTALFSAYWWSAAMEEGFT
jgi:hypothetical protein